MKVFTLVSHRQAPRVQLLILRYAPRDKLMALPLITNFSGTLTNVVNSSKIISNFFIIGNIYLFYFNIWLLKQLYLYYDFSIAITNLTFSFRNRMLHLHPKRYGVDTDKWLIKVMCGSIEFSTLYMNNHTPKIFIISRLSCERAGTRLVHYILLLDTYC